MIITKSAALPALVEGVASSVQKKKATPSTWSHHSFFFSAFHASLTIYFVAFTINWNDIILSLLFTKGSHVEM